MSDSCIVGEWKRLEDPPRCGSSIAHAACRFAKGNLDCTADAVAYDACPYKQSGSTIAVYPQTK